MSLAAGMRLGPYEILGPIGAGGMGEVYRAKDTRLDRTVAIKVLPAETSTDPGWRARLEREAKTLAALTHPHICTLHDIGSAGDIEFIVMECLAGETLAQRVGRGSIPLAEALQYAIELADALTAAHQAGLTHGDVKPANVILTAAGAKLLDFGLARSFRCHGPHDVTATATLTRSGIVRGTPAYMAPEQRWGLRTDARADVWALGVVIYEMLAGERPAPGNGAATTPLAPVASDTVPASFPASLSRVLERSLSQRPEARYASAGEMLNDLREAMREVQAAAAPSLVRQALGRMSRPRMAAVAALLLIGIAAAVGWALARRAQIGAARRRLPELIKLTENEQYGEAFALAREIGRSLPNDPILGAVWKTIAVTGSVESRPSGVEVYYRLYRDTTGPWIHVGRTPIQDARLPATLLRIRAEKEGYEPLLVARTAAMLVQGVRGRAQVPKGLDLQSHEAAVPGMVWVAGMEAYSPLLFHGLPSVPPVNIPDYWIDKHEVTNREYRAFVRAGGYARPEYWQHPFVKDGRPLPWRDAVAIFVDRTGRPGPANWQLSDYTPGEEDLPVTGVSWFEAAAYAAYAGKQLPSLYHWIRAATTMTAEILALSNIAIGGRRPTGLVRAGSSPGVSTWGAFDVAGNAKEWTANATPGNHRIVLGGAWDEPDYMFHTRDERDAFDRSTNIGFRCAKYSREGLSPEALTWKPDPPRSFETLRPVRDDVFDFYRELYSYDRTPIQPSVDSSEQDAAAGWRIEKVSYAAAGSSDERLFAYVFLPAAAVKPYQSIVFFPGSSATMVRSSRDAMPGPDVTFLVKSGRAVIFPVYKNTFERATNVFETLPANGTAYRDLQVDLSREVRRAVDYLESRADIDKGRIGYYGLSWGAAVAPLSLALEPRFRAAVVVSGGLLWSTVRPEADPVNFLPRVRTPVLMLNGEQDAFYIPPAQRAYFNLLGSPPGQKRFISYPGVGHLVPRSEGIRETLAWFDRFLDRPAIR